MHLSVKANDRLHGPLMNAFADMWVWIRSLSYSYAPKIAQYCFLSEPQSILLSKQANIVSPASVLQYYTICMLCHLRTLSGLDLKMESLVEDLH